MSKKFNFLQLKKDIFVQFIMSETQKRVKDLSVKDFKSKNTFKWQQIKWE